MENKVDVSCSRTKNMQNKNGLKVATIRNVYCTSNTLIYVYVFYIHMYV